MGTFDESELTAFQDRAAEQQAIIDEAAKLIAKASAYLVARGVQLDYTEVPESEDDAAATDTRLEVIDNKLRVVTMVTRILQNRVVADEIDPDTTSFSKKQIQAELVAQNLPVAWTDFVDQELPGVALTSDDSGMVAEASVNMFVADIESSDQLAATAATVEAIIDSVGSIDLADDDGHISRSLITIYATHTQRSLVWQEQARVMLIEQGVADNPDWQRVIDLLSD